MFLDIKTAKPLKTSRFSGFSLWPLSSVKFRQVRFLTLDSKSVREQSPASSNLAVSARKGLQKRYSHRKTLILSGFFLFLWAIFLFPVCAYKKDIFLRPDLNPRNITIFKEHRTLCSFFFKKKDWLSFWFLISLYQDIMISKMEVGLWTKQRLRHTKK